MTILVANIGTSDLAIRVEDGKYADKYKNLFLPIGLDRSEPNLVNDSGFGDIWMDARNFPREYAFEKFGIEQKKYAFRDFTEKLWKSYEQDNDEWQQRIHPGRIWSVVEKAIEFDVKSIYIFITDQPERNDTIFLFNILKKWFEHEWQSQDQKDVEIKAVLVPEDIAAIDQNKLLEIYYSFFNTIDRNEDLLISIKGGTYQMQTALRVQAMSSDNKLLFLDPQLSVKQVLEGKPSDCIVTSYWRYLRTQKYQTVKLLLNSRWDFDGAIEILKEWKSYLNFLIKQDAIDSEINRSSESIRLILQRLDIARNHLNLDSSWRLNYPVQPTDNLGNLQDVKNNYDKVLNLYTQCIILWNLNQVANFGFKLGSFCEEILHEIIIKLDGEKYFNKSRYPNDWYFTKSKAEIKSESGNTLWEIFYNIEIKQYRKSKLKTHDWKKYSSCKLLGRFTKRNFVKALIQFRGRNNEIDSWNKITESLKRLEYWIELRNTLTHSAEGFSMSSMATLLNHDCNRYKRGDRDDMAIKAHQACKHKEILDELTAIMNQMAELLNLSYGSYIGLEEPHYIYSDVKQWVIGKLEEEVSR